MIDDGSQRRSIFEYATDGFYCVDAVKDIPTHQIEVYITNSAGVNQCKDYITTDALEFHYVCQFVLITSGKSDVISLEDCRKYAKNNEYRLHDVVDLDYRVSGCFHFENLYDVYYNENENDIQCGTETCIQHRKPTSLETIQINTDARMLISLEYISVEGQVNLQLTIDPGIN